MISDNEYIERCLSLGEQAAGKGNTAAGALIVMNNEIICEAEEAVLSKNDISCHAELEAVRAAVRTLKTTDLSACILYSTHEPCVMCAYAIRFYKIQKVVYLHKSKYLGSVSSSFALLTTDKVPPHWANAPLVVQLEL